MVCPPSSRSMYQRLSLCWQLSMASPVTIVNCSGIPVRGPLPMPLMA